MMEPPAHLAWQCTKGCNLRCIHCYANAGREAGDELTTEEAERLMDSAAEMGIKSIVFTGGEPLLRQDILKLILFARDVGLKPIIATNGSRLNENIVQTLRDAGGSVAVDLPAVNEGVHGAFTGVPGSLQAKLEAIAECLRSGVSCSVGVAVTRVNVGEVHEVVGFAKKNNIYCDVLAVVPVGRAKPELLPDPMKYYGLMQDLLRRWHAVPMNAISEGAKTMVSVYEPFYVVLAATEGYEVPGKLCTLGRAIHVMEDGSVRPCTFAPIKVGNVRGQRLKDIWEAMTRSEVLTKLNNADLLKGSCGRCEHKKICGGCRVRAYAMTGDWFASDPMCFLTEVQTTATF